MQTFPGVCRSQVMSATGQFPEHFCGIWVEHAGGSTWRSEGAGARKHVCLCVMLTWSQVRLFYHSPTYNGYKPQCEVDYLWQPTKKINWKSIFQKETTRLYLDKKWTRWSLVRRDCGGDSQQIEFYIPESPDQIEYLLQGCCFLNYCWITTEFPVLIQLICGFVVKYEVNS